MARTLPPKRPVGRPRKTTTSNDGQMPARYPITPAAEIIDGPTVWRENNAARFIRVVYGNDQRKGRLEMLRQAFENLNETANSNHYEFSQGQAAAVVDAVEGYFQKFRKVFEAGPKRR